MRVLIVGKPGSGKSTLIRFVKSILVSRGQKLTLVNDFKVLKKMCPRNKKSNTYYYDSGDNLVLKPFYRDLIMRRLFVNLGTLWRRNYSKPLLMEVTHSQIDEISKKFFEVDRKNDGLVYVGCNLKTCQKRNSFRTGGSKIPSEYLKLFFENDWNLFEKMKVGFGRSLYISNKKDFSVLKDATKRVCRWLRKDFTVEANGK